MEIIFTKKVSVDVRQIKATMAPRYWVDCKYSEDNGNTWIEPEKYDVSEEEAKNHIPHVSKHDIGYGTNDYWDITIDIETGKIDDWKKDFCLKTWFKVCDDGYYQIIDSEGNIVWDSLEEKEYYVPDFLSVDSGYGDYVTLNIDGEGKIEKFNLLKERLKNYFC